MARETSPLTRRPYPQIVYPQTGYRTPLDSDSAAPCGYPEVAERPAGRPAISKWTRTTSYFWPNPRRHIDDILEARYFISEVPFEMRRRSGRRERSSDKWSQPRGGPRLCRSALFLSIDDLSELRAQVCKCEGLLQKCFAVPEDPHLNCAVRCKPRNIQDSEIRDGLH